MLEEFAKHVENCHQCSFDPVKDRINCLGHVINLATQILISTYGKSPHYYGVSPLVIDLQTFMPLLSICFSVLVSNGSAVRTQFQIYIKSGSAKKGKSAQIPSIC
ncbi:hypothetical protein QCA50_018092 [Cerrena zonata]|uniref:Uncharacterized protein n=1 Tax=Cerrena zonata TaxID=2478898 RepID=A0AAW0FFD2_9APHY